MRTYKGEIKLPPKNTAYRKFYRDGSDEFTIRPTGYYKRNMIGIRRGLKIVHIGEDVWRIGKEKHIKGKGLHQVIYGPNNKEYHLWDEDVKNLRMKGETDWGEEIFYGCHQNYADQAKVKIYILTSILDDRKNWCFDLTNIPELGYLKVIYNNGTIKNINFNGTFEKFILEEHDTSHYEYTWHYVRDITPVGYRKNI